MFFSWVDQSKRAAPPSGILCKANLYSNLTVTDESPKRSSRFVNCLRYRNASFFFGNVMYLNVCKICEKFGGCLWSFSQLGQKVKDSMRSSCDQVDYATSFC